MRVFATLPTAFGPRLAIEPSPLIAPDIDPIEAADQLDRLADAALAEGDGRLADRLSLRAHGVRAAAALAP